MAVLTVTFGIMTGSGPNGSVMPLFKARTGTHSEDITIGATSTKGSLTAAEELDRNVVELHAEAACYFEMGTDPTAQANGSQRMGAGETRHIPITIGHKVACIQVS